MEEYLTERGEKEKIMKDKAVKMLIGCKTDLKDRAGGGTGKQGQTFTGQKTGDGGNEDREVRKEDLNKII